MLAGAVSDTVYWGLFVGLNPFSSSGELDADGKAAIISTFFELAIGAWLVFGARGLGAFLWKVRTGGVAKS